jgi:hypothetical protein
MQPPLVQTIVDETPEIPEQGKVEMVLLNPFGEPMNESPIETDINGEKQTLTTMSRGQLVKVSNRESNTVSMDYTRVGMKEK